MKQQDSLPVLLAPRIRVESFPGALRIPKVPLRPLLVKRILGAPNPNPSNSPDPCTESVTVEPLSLGSLASLSLALRLRLSLALPLPLLHTPSANADTNILGSVWLVRGLGRSCSPWTTATR